MGLIEGKALLPRTFVNYRCRQRLPPALDTPRFVSPFPNVSAGPGIRDVRYCAGMHPQVG